MCISPSISACSSFAFCLSAGGAGMEGWRWTNDLAVMSAGGGLTTLGFDPVDEEGS